jgi:hypothetical protein
MSIADVGSAVHDISLDLFVELKEIRHSLELLEIHHMLSLDLEIVQVKVLNLFRHLPLPSYHRRENFGREGASVHHLGVVSDVRDGWGSALLRVLVKEATAATGQLLEVL